MREILRGRAFDVTALAARMPARRGAIAPLLASDHSAHPPTPALAAAERDDEAFHDTGGGGRDGRRRRS